MNPPTQEEDFLRFVAQLAELAGATAELDMDHSEHFWTKGQRKYVRSMCRASMYATLKVVVCECDEMDFKAYKPLMDKAAEIVNKANQ